MKVVIAGLTRNPSPGAWRWIPARGRDDKSEPELPLLLPRRQVAVSFLRLPDTLQVAQQRIQRRLRADAAAAAWDAVFGRTDFGVQVGDRLHGRDYSRQCY